ncbi:histidine kinase [Aliihoeflea aestuarii]|jgi:signal transduction histidine kinase|uniref:ATP-binding protein n=1 Tax=Aliihoeflea aestuarii TaxID=453840 RepID=UPI0025B308B1|nr:ATP-binding protein [Aliihoeflea aestuarii]MCO6389496.1 histidine kinase [Aliihoeflea aestuarii]
MATPASMIPRRLRLGSLTVRVIALSTLWALLTLVIIATVISTLFRQASERGFESLLSAHLFNLISTVSVTDDGWLQGAPNLGDLRFTIPRSGWYWSVEPISEGLRGSLRSISMIETVEAPSTAEVPFDREFQRRYVTVGLNGELLEVFESEFVLDNADRVGRFRVMGNRSELEEEIADFERQLYFYLALFGLGMIAINAIAIWVGLRPLSRVRRALAEIRSGNATRLDGRFPAEIAPLADETNALIESNRRIVERSRTQVGNLAHSLKTPLAVLLNEGSAMGGQKGSLIVGQATAMQSQVEHYLQRARVAAQRDSILFRTPVVATLERLVRVMSKLNRHLDISLDTPDEEIMFSGEKEDFEELVGNLLENATKWGKSVVSVSVGRMDAEEARGFVLTIEDDGPGIPDDQAKLAMKRGHRLDETKPGTGLGLSIVADLVKEYGGHFELGRSELGGLKAVIRLQRQHDERDD